MKNKQLIKFASFVFILLTTIQQTKSQVKNAFISYEGGFSINILEKNNGAGGNGTAGGVNFVWKTANANYEIGFFEKLGLSYALTGDTFSYEDCVKHYFNQFSVKGERISEKEVNSGIYKGKEYKYKTKDSFHILKLFEVEDRIYKLLAEFPLKEEKSEVKVLKIFDSFQLLDKEQVKIELNKRIAQATPKELPQAPKVPKIKSDIEDRELKGKVKSVFSSNSYYNLKNIPRKPLPILYEEFNTDGNLLKSTEYDSYGNSKTIKVYGYITGKRVANTGIVKYEYDYSGFGIPIEFPNSVKPDDRFDESYSYKYLNGRLVAENTYFSNGVRQKAVINSYLKNKNESQYFFGSEKVPYLKVENLLDDKGNITKSVFREKKGNKFEVTDTYQFKYESVDEQGNWTKRIVLKDYGFGITIHFVPEYIEQREINYY